MLWEEKEKAFFEIDDINIIGSYTQGSGRRRIET